MSSKDKDYRLITLVTDVCPLPLRELFLKLSKADRGASYTTLDNYMSFRKHDVEKLMKLPPKTIRKDQFDLIFPKADEAKWDVSLLSALLLGSFNKTLQNSSEETLIRIIRDVRNKLQHKTGSEITDDKEFDTTWNDLETATTTLAQIAGGQTYQKDIQKLIDEARLNNLPNLGDTLKSWFGNKLRNYGEASENALSILEATTKTRITQAGSKRKRLKTVDPIIKKLGDQYELTLTHELPDDFDPPKEASTIHQKLKQDHHVTICGYENSKYLACALSVINKIGYNRCVELTKPDDWRHIDPDEVDLVLYCDPFSLSMNPERKREFNDVFDGLMHASTVAENEARIDVVIVTDKIKLEKNSDFESHPIFENMVVLYQPTNEQEPVDLVKPQILYKRTTQNDNILGNMIAYSDAFIQQRKSGVIDPALLESAKEKFKRHKTIVITGPTGSGNTAFAVSLVSSIYDRYQCVVLVDSSEWKYVTLGEISVIIIDEFAGKSKYNAGIAESWLNRFDLIQAAVSEGKLNVIITCETARFSKVLKSFAGHPILNHRIKLPKRGVEVVIKEEPISDNELDVEPEQEQEQMRDLPGANINNDYRNSEKQEQCLLEGRLVATLKVDEKIEYCCEAQNGKVFVFGYGTHIALLDTSTCSINTDMELTHKADCISCIDEHQLVLFLQKENKLLYASLSNSDIKLGQLSDIPVQHKWTHLLRKGNQYIMCTENAVFIYDLHWKRTGTVSHSNNKPLFESNISRRSYMRDEKAVRDVDVGDSLIVIGTEEHIVTTDINGHIIKLFKPGGQNVALYDDRRVFVRDGSKITIVTVTGKVIGILYKGDLPVISSRNYYRCFCFGRSCNKLFVSGYDTLTVLSVQ